MAANRTGFVFLGIMVVSWRNRRTSATLSLTWPARSVHQQIRKTMGDPKKGQHVAALLPFVLPVKSLTINDVADVADFPDLHINLAILRGKSVVRWFLRVRSTL